jgi:predicted metal-dependent hydrolase
VSRKSARIAKLMEQFGDDKLDPHYLGYFDCFNRGLFFEAHEVLEELWLRDKHGPNGAFYKGLIQLTGAFVHVQKDRLRPAAALFKLALANLEKYPREHEHLNLAAVCRLIQKWLGRLESARFEQNPLADDNAPKLALELPPTKDST